MSDGSQVPWTHGPWEAREDGCIRVAGDPFEFVILASPWREGAWNGDSRAVANARLISKAPEMARLVERLKDRYQTKLVREDFEAGDTIEDATDMARRNSLIREAEALLAFIHGEEHPNDD